MKSWDKHTKKDSGENTAFCARSEDIRNLEDRREDE